MPIYTSVCSGKQVLKLNVESFDRVKLSRLNFKYCKPTNIWANFPSNWCRCSPWWSPCSWIHWFNEYRVWISCEYGQYVWIWYEYRVLMCCLFTLSLRDVDRINTQVRLLTSLNRFAGRVNSELLASMIGELFHGNFHGSIQYMMSKHFLKCHTFCLFPE